MLKLEILLHERTLPDCILVYAASDAGTLTMRISHEPP